MLYNPAILKFNYRYAYVLRHGKPKPILKPIHAPETYASTFLGVPYYNYSILGPQTPILIITQRAQYPLIIA